MAMAMAMAMVGVHPWPQTSPGGPIASALALLVHASGFLAAPAGDLPSSSGGVMPEAISTTVFAALSRQLRMPPAELIRLQGESLDRLGLDSHGLMRVLLEIERELGLPASLELPDDALESPSTLAAGVAAAVAGG
jgi:acyl carrier protein